jgi:hypothetical protein
MLTVVALEFRSGVTGNLLNVKISDGIGELHHAACAW